MSRPPITIHPALPPVRLVNKRTQEYVGCCPQCGGDHRSDRFHVWMEPDKERFWCRRCGYKGFLASLTNVAPSASPATPRACARSRHVVPPPRPEDVCHYRQLYEIVALWAHRWLRDEANPDPRAYLHRRGIDDSIIAHHLLGASLRDPQALVAYLTADYPELLPYAENAGVLVADGAGSFRTHSNLCQAIIIPYIAEGAVVDLRTRAFPNKGYRSLAGGYEGRGAVFPFGWDDLCGATTVVITEGEFKAAAVTATYRAGRFSAPAIAHPGLSYWREEWAGALLARGITTVVLAYDSQPRTIKDGVLHLAPEEHYTIKHGLALAAAGLQVRVLRLPLVSGASKADLDDYLFQHGPAALERLISAAPLLAAYHDSLPRRLLDAANLPPPASYPQRRARPAPSSARPPASARPTTTLADARAAIPRRVADHATTGKGMLLLAHPPGVGKGYGTQQGLWHYLQNAPTPGVIVWTALRHAQLHDQQALPLIPLYGRNDTNCRKLGEAQTLAAKGYPVREALCMRRCPFVNHCRYLQQFNQEGDLFAPQPLLQATGWWSAASVIVLDEFDPGQLVRHVTLPLTSLVAMTRATADPHAHTLLDWLGHILADTFDRRLTGTLLLDALHARAADAGHQLSATIQAALAALPPEEERARLGGLPAGAALADYQALPPAHLPALLRQLDHEAKRCLHGHPFTSRLEAGDGVLTLFLRQDHLVAQLADPHQPKVLLDATAHVPLLSALFPDTPLAVEQPHIPCPARVVQVLGNDWAKTGLRGTRRARWHDTVAACLRPGRPALVVCTKECVDDLRAGLAARGHAAAVVAHYGSLRGSNAYVGYDVVLAQAYNPNLHALVREGRALFADDPVVLDERIITVERPLVDATGAGWNVPVVTFADARLAALLEQRREAELYQAALRGRPFDHPDSQITLLFSLPLATLPPTAIEEAPPSAQSNGGRQGRAILALIAAAQQRLSNGQHMIGVDDLAGDTGSSVRTARAHLAAVGLAIGLSVQTQQHTGAQARGKRVYNRTVLAAPVAAGDSIAAERAIVIDHARNKDLVTRVIHHSTASPPAPPVLVIASASATRPATSPAEPSSDTAASPTLALTTAPCALAVSPGTAPPTGILLAPDLSLACAQEQPTISIAAERGTTPAECDEMIDHARNKDLVTCVIYHSAASSSLPPAHGGPAVFAAVTTSTTTLPPEQHAASSGEAVGPNNRVSPFQHNAPANNRVGLDSANTYSPLVNARPSGAGTSGAACEQPRLPVALASARPQEQLPSSITGLLGRRRIRVRPRSRGS